MVTLKDVAKKAQVSVSTVSCVLRDAPNVSLKVKKHVRKIMKDMGYVPNSLARGMVGSATQKIAYFFPGFHDFPWSNNAHIIEGLGLTLQEAEYSLNFVPLQGDKPLREMHRFYAAARPDAAVFHDVILTTAHLDEIEKKLPCPCIFMNNRVKHPAMSFVGMDEESGGHMATQHLVELGHRRIGILGPLKEGYFGQYRLAGYRRALTEAGLHKEASDPSLQLNVSWFQSPQSEVLPVISAAKATGITALFCLSDVLAAEAMLAAQSLGVKVPDELSIVGCDDDPFVRFLRPQLTSVASPGVELGRLSGRLILEWIKQRPPVPQHILLPARLVKRDSTAARKS